MSLQRVKTVCVSESDHRQSSIATLSARRADGHEPLRGGRMKNRLRLAVAALTVAGLAIAAAGCGGGGGKSSNSSGGTTSNASVGQLASSQVLTMSWGAEPPSLDP